jgi:hypothetical protein
LPQKDKYVYISKLKPNKYIEGLIKTNLEIKIIFRLSRGVAGGFWTKFEVQLSLVKS